MEVLNTIIGIPLGYILYFCYQLSGSFGIAILLFTLVTKVLLFPLSLISQKNSIAMVRMQPALEEIKQRFAGNSALVLEEQSKLYKREHYSMIKGMLPLLIQIPIILGLINVIYNPLQHLLHISPQVIEAMVAQTATFLELPPAELGFSAQLKVMELVQSQPQLFSQIPNASDVVVQIQAVDTQFLGINMALNPGLFELSVIYPLLSALSALVLCLFQNRYNVLQVNQGFWGKWGMAIFLVAFSAYFAAVLPCGVGLYWIAGNLLSIVVLALCNLVYDPRKYIDFSALPVKPQLTRAERAAQRALKKRLHAREKADARRFYQAADKQLVFYSEASGFYKYYQRLIDYLLAHSDLTIHYVTSDANDQVFALATSRLQVYYIGPTALISFMMKLDADMVIMTMPDLETFHIKRSLVRKDIEYVYLDHGMGSFHLVLREHALDHFDTVFVYGPNHIAELRRAEELYDLPEKTLVPTGFGLLDYLLEKVAALPQTVNQPPVALVAPSWQKDNLLELCLDDTLQPLLKAGFKVIVRPHPEFVKRFGERLDAIRENYAAQIEDGNLVLETDFSSNLTVYTADVVVTDWSTIAQEFSFSTRKPSISVNTPMKVINPNWELLELEPLEISLRRRIGVALDTDDLEKIGDVARELVAEREQWRQRIGEVLEETVFNIGHSEEAMGDYVITVLAQAAQLRERQQAAFEQKLAGLSDA
ncbi:MAG: membrane protein insertase YidC [Coriobacteriales bacterium]|nr:membrane protein insertase YidC [Coriobacteriales bacterium]